MPCLSTRFLRLSLLSLAGLSSLSALALDVPNPPQPEAQALVKRFQADYLVIKADANYFKPPAAPMAMPCEIAPRDLYPAIGLFLALPEEAEKVRLASRKSLRDMGMDADTAAMPMQYSNIRITPLKASCKSGKLDGEAQFLAQYDTLMENSNNMNIAGKMVKMTNRFMSQQSARYQLNFKDGKLVQSGEKFNAIQTALRNEMVIDDAQMAATMSKTKIPDAPEPQVALNYMNFEVGQMAMFTVSMAPKISAGLFGVNTSFQQQLDSHFTLGMGTAMNRMDMYKNDKLFMTSATPMKNGNYHGEQIQTQENYLKASGMRLDQMPGMEQARLVMVNGVEMLETRSCFIDGVLTKVLSCPKD